MKLGTELSKDMRLHAEVVRTAREKKLSEHMKPGVELSEHVQLDTELPESGRPSPEPRTELSKCMRLHAEIAHMAHEAKLSERMEPNAELFEHLQLDAEFSECGLRSPEPRDPWHALSAIPGF
ncbi:hypothetical protein Ancab_017147 [Ancistrocladus abbreviatus]